MVEVDPLAAGVDTLVGQAEVLQQRLRQVIRVIRDPLQSRHRVSLAGGRGYRVSSARRERKSGHPFDKTV